MRCEEVRTHHVEHLAGTLDATDVEALETHLASCAECREEYSGLRRSGMPWGGCRQTGAVQKTARAVVRDGCGERASVSRGPHPAEMDGPVVSSPPWPVRTRLAQLAVAASLLLVGAIAGRASITERRCRPIPARRRMPMRNFRGCARRTADDASDADTVTDAAAVGHRAAARGVKLDG